MLLSKNIKKILVTGGAGFIGSHLVDVLVKQNKDVTVFDNLTSGKKDFLKTNFTKKNFRFIYGDLLNTDQLDKTLNINYDTIFHLAANPDISQGINNPQLDFNQTIKATFNLLQSARKYKIKKIIYFSGSGVYGDIGYLKTKESFGPLLPVSMYGGAKLSAEAIISAFSNLFDMQVWILRPANIIGPRATHGVIFDFIKKLSKNPRQLVILGDGKQSKSYLYIDDVISAIFMILTKAQNKMNIFNIASGSYITVNEIAEMIIKKMNLKNVGIIHTKGNIGWPGDVPIVRQDFSKLKKIGWYCQNDSYQAVEKTIMDLLQ